jgi:hypothetical protein
MQPYPRNIKPDTQAEADALNVISRLRDQDIIDRNNLPNIFISGRSVNKIPSSSTDVATTDRIGDYNAVKDYLYLCVNDGSGGSLWQRTQITWPEPTTNYPKFYAYCSSATSTTSTPAKVALNATVFDTGSYFDIVNHKYIPLIAGYYFINVAYFWSSYIDQNYYLIQIYKNGSGISYNSATASGVNGITVTGSMMVQMNGSTDYLELYLASQNSATTLSNSPTNCFMQGFLMP